MTQAWRSASALVLVLVLAACSRQDAAPPAPPPVVLTTFYPLTDFAQRIAGDRVPVECPLPAGADPSTWQPTRHDVAAYHGATLILVNGAGFEGWLDKVSLPQSRVVDTSRAFADRFLKHATVTHSHGGDGAHAHAGIDGHTWLDPLLAKQQAQAIHDGFVQAWPQDAAAFGQRLASLHQDLDGLHARLLDVSAKLTDVKLLASHPSYNYLAARYGWQVVNLDLDPQAELTAEEKEALAAARGGAARTILLWESEPRRTVADALAAEGIRSVVFSPLERPPAEPGYVEGMRANLERLAAAAR
jgi:zinc transport system substrate-binding protein